MIAKPGLAITQVDQEQGKYLSIRAINGEQVMLMPTVRACATPDLTNEEQHQHEESN